MDCRSSDDDNDFEPSEIGKKSYWDDVYERELNNYIDSGDNGHVWFGENSVRRVVKWITKCKLIFKDSKILDVGCGNGNILTSLADEGYAKLFGIDYSENAIDLAKKVSENEVHSIVYEVADFLKYDSNQQIASYDVVIDKGTFDAISLHTDDPKSKLERYRDVVFRILKDDGFFIITTCNWTEDEITSHFKKDFNIEAIIPTKKIQFGGKSGNDVSCVVFKKNLVDPS